LTYGNEQKVLELATEWQSEVQLLQLLLQQQLLQQMLQFSLHVNSSTFSYNFVAMLLPIYRTSLT